MIFDCWYEDDRYHRWFAWYPVELNGPDEWERCQRLRCGPRVVWLQYVWRLKTRPGDYYALPDSNTRNSLLLESIATPADG